MKKGITIKYVANKCFSISFRSTKLKPFWLSLNEKEDNIAILDVLSKALLGESVEEEGNTGKSWSAPEYDAALHRAVKIPTCPVVPFFGAYVRELRNILSSPSLVVVSTGSENQQLQVKLKATKAYIAIQGKGETLSLSSLLAPLDDSYSYLGTCCI